MQAVPTKQSPALPAYAGGIPIRSGKPYLVFQAPDIREEDIAAVTECLRSRWIGTGPQVEALERQFAAYKGAEHCVAVNSCTAALFLSLLAQNIGEGDEVITTAMTFCSTVNAILHTGATPVIVDCDRETRCIDPEAIRRAVTPRTKAVVVVHMTGRACDMDAIMAIASDAGLYVVEDCAHAIETEYHGRKVGTIGDAGCFSFYTNKNLTTAEGGMIATHDGELAERLRRLALHGMTRHAWRRFSAGGYEHYDVVAPGFKMNLTDLAASLGLQQLKRIDATWERRRQIWMTYREELADTGLELPAAPEPGTRHAYHLFAPLVRPSELRVGRDQILSMLHAEGVGTGVHYRAVPMLQYYRESLGLRYEDFPNACYIGEHTFSLPIAAWMNDEDVADVVRATRRILTYFAVFLTYVAG